MSVLTVDYPTAPTTDLRDWLRTVTAVTDLVDQRIWAGGLPKTATLPAVALAAVGGRLDNTGLDQGLWQFDCWADTGPEAEELANTVAAALVSADARTALTSGATFAGAAIEGRPLWAPDDADTPRYILTANITIRP